MIYKEALNWLDEHIIGNLKVKETISRALQKQIPFPPYKKEFATVVIHYCPRCGEDLELRPNFCSECGQAIDWSE